MKINNPPLLYSGMSTQSADLHASRLLDGTVYQNPSSTKPMFISACLDLPANAEVLVVNGNTPSSPVADVFNGNVLDIFVGISFWVLPNHKYKMTTLGGFPTNKVWIEWL